MKLQVAFDCTDLDQAITVAKEIADYADILEIGSLLIYKYGEQAIKRFRDEFPQKTILADAKIADRGKDAVTIFASAGADWITVMAGAGKNVIHVACTQAHILGKKIILDLLDSSSLGQSALEAQSLGVDAVLFHKPSDEEDQLSFFDRWEMVRGNTKLPIFISTNITRESINDILAIGPHAIIISKPIVLAQNPRSEAEFYSKAIKD